MKQRTAPGPLRKRADRAALGVNQEDRWDVMCCDACCS